MTGIDKNLEALAEKEYRQDEATLSFYEAAVAHAEEEIERWELERKSYIGKILEIQKKRKGSHER